ncbi:hypothetical protein NYI21_004084, partial [Salmonella enterica]|nr:hypothetical protein [Salmonella enterica]EJQ8866343.1 hypothetical protein [Salmonella enterica]EJQ9407758.1 hypothetical protein [Salmonella enterica]
SAANADNKETITVTLTPRDSHNNVVPLWTFRKDLTIVPSVNATVPGAVTVTTPAQDAAGNVAATLTYVDTSGQLLSKAARTGTTSVSIGSAVKKTFDTRFYPQVNICLTNLDSNGFVTPGTTEVHICDGSGHTIPVSSGYSVAAPALSSTACPAHGGGVCPSDAAGVKADFENLTGDDILALANTPVEFRIQDMYAAQEMLSRFTSGAIAFYSELSSHKRAADLSATVDLFRTADAQAFCHPVVANPNIDNKSDIDIADQAAAAVQAGTPTGGVASKAPDMQSVRMGGIASAITTGGDTNPEIFVDGIGRGTWPVGTQMEGIDREINYDPNRVQTQDGSYIPAALVFVNGGRSSATSWTFARDRTLVDSNDGGIHYNNSIGLTLHTATGWNLSDAYYVNNWPGTPYTLHKGNGDSAYHYVTQVNYITGYICAASLH